MRTSNVSTQIVMPSIAYVPMAERLRIAINGRYNSVRAVVRMGYISYADPLVNVQISLFAIFV